MKYYEVRQLDMTVIGEIDTGVGDNIAVRAGHFLIGKPMVDLMIQNGGHADAKSALEANGYIWGIVI